jgi:hypothetical protein
VRSARARRRSSTSPANIVGEARLVERAFGLGPCALTEADQLVGERFEAA